MTYENDSLAPDVLTYVRLGDFERLCRSALGVPAEWMDVDAPLERDIRVALSIVLFSPQGLDADELVGKTQGWIFANADWRNTPGDNAGEFVKAAVAVREFVEARDLPMKSRLTAFVLGTIFPVSEVVELSPEELSRVLAIASAHPGAWSWSAIRGILAADIDIVLLSSFLGWVA